MDVHVSERPPTAAEYINLRARMGWGTIDEATALKTMQAAAFTVCLRDDEWLIGLARVWATASCTFSSPI